MADIKNEIDMPSTYYSSSDSTGPLSGVASPTPDQAPTTYGFDEAYWLVTLIMVRGVALLENTLDHAATLAAFASLFQDIQRPWRVKKTLRDLLNARFKYAGAQGEEVPEGQQDDTSLAGPQLHAVDLATWVVYGELFESQPRHSHDTLLGALCQRLRLIQARATEDLPEVFRELMEQRLLLRAPPSEAATHGLAHYVLGVAQANAARLDGDIIEALCVQARRGARELGLQACRDALDHYVRTKPRLVDSVRQQLPKIFGYPSFRARYFSPIVRTIQHVHNHYIAPQRPRVVSAAKFTKDMTMSAASGLASAGRFLVRKSRAAHRKVRRMQGEDLEEPDELSLDDASRPFLHVVAPPLSAPFHPLPSAPPASPSLHAAFPVHSWSP